MRVDLRVDLRVANLLYEQPPFPFVQKKKPALVLRTDSFFSSDLIEEFLCFHNIPATVWNTVNDSDSYARASALLVTGSLACRSKLWTSLLQNSQLSEVFPASIPSVTYLGKLIVSVKCQ